MLKTSTIALRSAKFSLKPAILTAGARHAIFGKEACQHALQDFEQKALSAL